MRATGPPFAQLEQGREIGFNAVPERPMIDEDE